MDKLYPYGQYQINIHKIQTTVSINQDEKNSNINFYELPCFGLGCSI